MLEFAVSHTSCDGIMWVKLMELLPLCLTGGGCKTMRTCLTT